MSTIRDPAVITNAGRQMMTAGGDISYTKAVLYGQDISHLTQEQLVSLTSIGNPLMTVPVGISDKNNAGANTTVVLEATFQNTDLKADLPYTAVGFFAKKDNGEEKLVILGVANSGAYLAAISPDGVATDALDIKVAIAIGDATNVTAVIDPAGSVTPATLNSAISKATHELTAKIDTKADSEATQKALDKKANKFDVEASLATKANSTDLDKTIAEVAKKANSDDVKAQIDGVSKSISDVSDTVKANKDATDQALATKADKTDVAKDIDTVNKSISSMSATITANQKATDTALDTKADKTTVNQELATKANSTDVDDKLAAKADSADVTKQIKTITDLANTKADQTALDATNATVATKANSTDVDSEIAGVTKSITDVSNTVKANKDDADKALATKADKTTVEQELAVKANSSDVDKKLDEKADKSSVDAKINAIDFSKIKFRKQYLTQNGTSSDKTWNATKNSDGSYTIDIYQDDWTADKVASLLQAITTKADQSSLDATNKTVATKANSSDVYTKKQVDDAFSSRDATIATKADKATVDTEISKIDFTPYAKTADVNKEIKTVTDLANTKVDATYSYSKAELDKKLLALSTDTSGKVGADQVAQMIAGKADKDAVDKQIKAVTDSVATKANSDDVYSKTEANNLITDAKNTGKQAQATADSALAGYNQRPVISGGASDDLLSFKTTQLRYYPGNGNTCKNLPPATNQQWFTVEYIFENPNGDGIAIYRSPANEIWTIGNNSGNYDQAWVKVANANDIQGLQNQINTKADKATVDAEIAKIDFTPYAKSADVANELQNYTTTVDLNKLLAGKEDAGTSYSKAELDKKLLTLSTDADGKVNADQVSSMIANKVDKSDLASDLKSINDSIATKADKTTVESDLAVKANSADVYTKKQVDDALSSRDTAIATKADKATVNAQIADAKNTIKSNVDNLQSAVNTKANASDLSALQNSAMQVIDGNSGDDILSFRDEKIRRYNSVQNVKNLPAMSNINWFYVITHTKDDWGNVTVISQDNCYWQNALNGSNWSGWVKHATSVDITDLQNQINAKLNKTDTVNVVNSYDVNNNQNGGVNKWPVTQAWYVDQNALHPFADQINQLKGRRTVDAPDFNTLTDSGVYMIGNPSNGKSFPSDAAGTLVVFNGNDTRITQLYVGDDGVSTYMRIYGWINGGTAWGNWNKIAWKSDISNLQNAVNSKADQLNAMLTGLNHLQGKQTKDSADANALSETGVYYCSSPAKNFPVSQWGTLVTSNGNGARASQLYFPDDNSAVWFRTLDGDWQGWVRLASIGDVNNAESSLTSSINAVNNKVNVTVPLFRRITAGNTWNDILGASNGDTPVLVSIRDEGGANTLGNFSAAVAFGGGDTKGVLNVAYGDHTARIIGGNGNAPVWHEDIAWKSDINSLNSTISALQQTVQSLQNTVNQQATQITGLQTQVNNQANEIKQLQETTIKGKTFSKSQEAAAEAWEKQNSQRIAFITDN